MLDKDLTAATTATLLDQKKDQSSTEGLSEPGKTGTEPKRLTELLPDDLKENKSLAGFSDVVALAKGFVDLKSLQGQSVRIPGEDATAEERGKFYEKLGQPATKEGYELAIAESLGQKSEDVDNYRKQVHALNLTKSQAEALWKWSVDTAKNKRDLTLAGIQKQKDDSMASLRRPENWGTDTDANLALANKVGMRFGGDDFLKLMRESRVGDNSIMLEFLVAVGKSMSEDTLVGGVLKPEKPEGAHSMHYDKRPEFYKK